MKIRRLETLSLLMAWPIGLVIGAITTSMSIVFIIMKVVKYINWSWWWSSESRGFGKLLDAIWFKEKTRQLVSSPFD